MARFGQFSNLQGTTSAAAPEAYPDTATLSFHGATYTSPYLSFSGVERQTNTQQPLDALSSEDKTVFDTVNPGGSIPFIDYEAGPRRAGRPSTRHCSRARRRPKSPVPSRSPRPRCPRPYSAAPTSSPPGCAS